MRHLSVLVWLGGKSPWFVMIDSGINMVSDGTLLKNSRMLGSNLSFGKLLFTWMSTMPWMKIFCSVNIRPICDIVVMKELHSSIRLLKAFLLSLLHTRLIGVVTHFSLEPIHLPAREMGVPGSSSSLGSISSSVVCGVGSLMSYTWFSEMWPVLWKYLPTTWIIYTIYIIYMIYIVYARWLIQVDLSTPSSAPLFHTSNWEVFRISVLSCPRFAIHWRNMELSVPRKGVMRFVPRTISRGHDLWVITQIHIADVPPYQETPTGPVASPYLGLGATLRSKSQERYPTLTWLNMEVCSQAFIHQGFFFN